MTLGVLHRVEELADRESGVRPASAGRICSFVPLSELLAEVLGVAPASRRVQEAWRKLITQLGPELFILERALLSEIAAIGPPNLDTAISHMRSGQVRREAGYDGIYGRIACLNS